MEARIRFTKKPDGIPEGLHRIFVVLSCILALILSFLFAGKIEEDFSDPFLLAMLKISIGSALMVITFFGTYLVTYSILVVFTLLILWIVDGFTQ